MKKIKKVPKRFLSLFLVLAILFSSVFPIAKTKAEEQSFGTGDLKMQLGLETNVGGYQIDSVTVDGNEWHTDGYEGNQYRYLSSTGEYTIVIKVISTEPEDPTIQWGGNWRDHMAISNTSVESKHDEVIGDYNLVTITLSMYDLLTPEALADPDIYQTANFINPNLSVVKSQPVQDPNQGQGNNPDPGQGNEPHTGDHFDGRAVLIWSCQSGGICYHNVEVIPNFDDGKSYFINSSEMIDARTGERFSIDAKYKGWSTPERFDRWVEDYRFFNNIEGAIDWSKVDPKDMLSAPIDKRQYESAAIANGCSKNEPEDVFMDCVDHYLLTNRIAFPSRAHLQPVGEPQYPNAYVSYGDRNFKVVVYNDNYRGISYGSLGDLNYYPASWGNAYTSRDQFDISNTSKDKPESIPAILLERTLNIKAINVNGFEITKLEALDVSKDAVSITKENGEWKLVFSSNFYDKVVFKATGNDGKEYYFQVNRYTIDGWIRGENGKSILTTDFFFDNNNSYNDFDLTAKILYKDGTVKAVTLNPVKRIDDGLGNITKEYEVDEEHPTFGPAGKGLKRSAFEYPLADGEEKRILDIYINAEYKGSTSTNYAGAFSGSGKGVLANIYHGEEN